MTSNYEPVVHLKQKKKKKIQGTERKKSLRNEREWANEREQECMMKEFNVEIKEIKREREQKRWEMYILAYSMSGVQLWHLQINTNDKK